MAQAINEYKIPFASSSAWFTRPVSILGVTYTLEFQYNAREQRWYMDILDIGERPLLRGVRLDINRNLTGQYGSYALPSCIFFCRDSSGENLPPTRNSFALNHVLLFLDTTTK